MRALLLVLLLMLCRSPATAQQRTTEYDDEVEPKRVALVLGNAWYRNLEPIPNATRDAEVMAEVLHKLGFAVVRDSMLSATDFWERVMPSFRTRIDSGAFVVVFVSGHGFSTGINNWLAPLEFPSEIPDAQLGSTAVSVENVGSYLAQESPGGLVFLLDACRTVPKLRVVIDRDSLVPVGGPAGGDRFPGGIIAFSAQLGSFAVGDIDVNSASAFARALGRYLPEVDRPFESTFKDVQYAVHRESGEKQMPDFAGTYYVEVHFKAGEVVTRQQRTLWSRAHRAGDKADSLVLYFSKRYPLSRHAVAARRWLRNRDESTRDVGFTYLSPLAVERAWSAANPAVSVERTAIGLAFARSADVLRDSLTERLSDFDLGLRRRATTSSLSLLAADISAAIAHSTMVATRALELKARPSQSATTLATVLRDQPLTILGTSSTDRLGSWVSALLPGGADTVFLRLTRQSSEARRIRLGTPLEEVHAEPSRFTVGALAADTIVGTLRRLRRGGHEITWISLAVGAPVDSNQVDLAHLRLAYAEQVVLDEGIDGRRITSVSSASDVSAGQVRVRIFGWRP